MSTTPCFNCRQEISSVATVCPFCRLYPHSYGDGPGISTPPLVASSYEHGYGGVGLFTALRNFFFGDPEVPRLNKVRSDEATYSVKNLPGCVDGSTGLPVPRKWCDKCGYRYNELEATRCSHCKRKFVEKYIIG